jgi:hypothetical protein
MQTTTFYLGTSPTWGRSVGDMSAISYTGAWDATGRSISNLTTILQGGVNNCSRTAIY